MRKAHLIILALSLLLVACSEDQQNKLFRKTVEFMDGNYLVTFASGPTSKTWVVRGGKVTSDPKGYYYFWDDKKHYVQIPIENSVVEEIN